MENTCSTFNVKEELARLKRGECSLQQFFVRFKAKAHHADELQLVKLEFVELGAFEDVRLCDYLLRFFTTDTEYDSDDNIEYTINIKISEDILDLSGKTMVYEDAKYEEELKLISANSDVVDSLQTTHKSVFDLLKDLGTFQGNATLLQKLAISISNTLNETILKREVESDEASENTVITWSSKQDIDDLLKSLLERIFKDTLNILSSLLGKLVERDLEILGLTEESSYDQTTWRILSNYLERRCLEFIQNSSDISAEIIHTYGNPSLDNTETLKGYVEDGGLVPALAQLYRNYLTLKYFDPFVSASIKGKHSSLVHIAYPGIVTDEVKYTLGDVSNIITNWRSEDVQYNDLDELDSRTQLLCSLLPKYDFKSELKSKTFLTPQTCAQAVKAIWDLQFNEGVITTVKKPDLSKLKPKSKTSFEYLKPFVEKFGLEWVNTLLNYLFGSKEEDTLDLIVARMKNDLPATFPIVLAIILHLTNVNAVLNNSQLDLLYSIYLGVCDVENSKSYLNISISSGHYDEEKKFLGFDFSNPLDGYNSFLQMVNTYTGQTIYEYIWDEDGRIVGKRTSDTAQDTRLNQMKSVYYGSLSPLLFTNRYSSNINFYKIANSGIDVSEADSSDAKNFVIPGYSKGKNTFTFTYTLGKFKVTATYTINTDDKKTVTFVKPVFKITLNDVPVFENENLIISSENLDLQDFQYELLKFVGSLVQLNLQNSSVLNTYGYRHLSGFKKLWSLALFKDLLDFATISLYTQAINYAIIRSEHSKKEVKDIINTGELLPSAWDFTKLGEGIQIDPTKGFSNIFNTLLELSQTKESVENAVTSSTLKDGSGAAITTANLLTLDGIAKIVWAEHIKDYPNAPGIAFESLFKNYRGVEYNRTLKSDEAVSATEFSEDDYLTANVIYDWFESVNDPNASVYILPLVISDKSKLPKLQIKNSFYSEAKKRNISFGEARIPEIREKFRTELGAYYYTMYQHILEDLDKLAAIIAPECSIKLYDNFESFNDWVKNHGDGKTAKQILDEAIQKLNTTSGSTPVEIVLNLHYIINKNGTIKANPALIHQQFVWGMAPEEELNKLSATNWEEITPGITEDSGHFFDRKAKQFARDMIVNNYTLSLLNSEGVLIKGAPLKIIKKLRTDGQTKWMHNGYLVPLIMSSGKILKDGKVTTLDYQIVDKLDIADRGLLDYCRKNKDVIEAELQSEIDLDAINPNSPKFNLDTYLKLHNYVVYNRNLEICRSFAIKKHIELNPTELTNTEITDLLTLYVQQHFEISENTKIEELENGKASRAYKEYLKNSSKEPSVDGFIEWQVELYKNSRSSDKLKTFAYNIIYDLGSASGYGEIAKNLVKSLNDIYYNSKATYDPDEGAATKVNPSLVVSYWHSELELEVNPYLEKYNLVSYGYGLEYTNTTVGSFINHPYKKGKTIEEIESEMFGQQTKRNVSSTASVHSFMKNSLLTISPEYKITVISDLKHIVTGANGVNTSATIWDGATFCNPVVNYLENWSLWGDAVGTDKKQFAAGYNPRTGTGIILKTAGFVCTNDRMRRGYQGPNNSGVDYLFHRHMNSRSWNGGNMVNWNSTYNGTPIINSNEFVFVKTENGFEKRTNFRWEGGITKYDCYQYNKDGQYVDVKETKSLKVTNNFLLWEVFGGMDTVKSDGVTPTNIGSEDSITFLARAVALQSTKKEDIPVISANNVTQTLKDSLISYVATAGAVKLGAANIVDAEKLMDPKNENVEYPYMTMKTTDIGVQLNAEHAADGSVLSLMTLVLNALGARGYSAKKADLAYAALYELTKMQLDNLFQGTDINGALNGKLLDAIKERLIKIVVDSVRSENSADLLGAIINGVDEFLKSEDISKVSDIPLSHPTIAAKIVSNIAAALTSKAVKTSFDGSMCVMVPSDKRFRLINGYTADYYKLNPEKYNELLTINKNRVDNWDDNKQSIGNIRLGKSYYVKVISAGSADSNSFWTPESGVSSKDAVSVLIENPVDYWKLRELEAQGNTVEVIEDITAPTDLLAYNAVIKDTEGNTYNLYDLESAYVLSQIALNNEALITELITRHTEDWQSKEVQEKLVSILPEAKLTGAEDVDTRLKQVEYLRQKYLAQYQKDLEAISPNGYESTVTLYSPIKNNTNTLGVENNTDALKVKVITVDKSQTIEQPYELIAPMIFKTEFGLVEGDDVLDIVDNKNFFEDRLRVSRDLALLSTTDEENNLLWHVALVRNGSQLLVKLLDKKTDHRIGNKVKIEFAEDNGTYYRLINGEKAYPIPVKKVEGQIEPDIEIYDYNGQEVVYTENAGKFLDPIKGTSIEFNSQLFESNKEDGKKIFNSIYATFKGSKNKAIKRFQRSMYANKDFAINKLTEDSESQARDFSSYWKGITPEKLVSEINSDKLLGAILTLYKAKTGKVDSATITEAEETVREFIEKYNTNPTAFEIWKTEDGEKSWINVLNSLSVKASNYELAASIYKNSEAEKLLYDKLMLDSNGEYLYDYISVIENDTKSLNELKATIGVNDDAVLTYLLNHIKTNSRVGKEMHLSFQKSLEFIAARTPAQSHQSFMAMKVVGFDTAGVNSAYVNRMQLVLQGSDYDIDKVSLLGYLILNGTLATHSPYISYNSLETLNATLNLGFPTGKKLEPADDNNLKSYAFDKCEKSVTESLDDVKYIESPEGTISSEYKIKTVGAENNYILIKRTSSQDGVLVEINLSQLKEFDTYLIYQFAHAIDNGISEGERVIFTGADPTLLDSILENLQNCGWTLVSQGEITYWERNTDPDYIEDLKSYQACFADGVDDNPIKRFLAEHKQGDVKSNLGKIVDFINTMSKLGVYVESNTSADIQLLVDTHNTYLENLSTRDKKKACLNFIAHNMISIAKDPINLVQAQSPIDDAMDILKAIANKSPLALTSLMDPGSQTSIIKQLKLTLSGKRNVGIVANALKVFEAFSLYYYITLLEGTKEEQELLLALRKLGGKELKLIANTNCINGITIKSDRVKLAVKAMNQAIDAFITLSGLLSAATDNAKDPILYKMNASPEMIKLYTAGTIMGFNIYELQDIILSKTGLILNEIQQINHFSKNSDINTLDKAIAYIKLGPENPIKDTSALGPIIIEFAQAYNFPGSADYQILSGLSNQSIPKAAIKKLFTAKVGWTAELFREHDKFLRDLSKFLSFGLDFDGEEDMTKIPGLTSILLTAIKTAIDNYESYILTYNGNLDKKTRIELYKGRVEILKLILNGTFEGDPQEGLKTILPSLAKFSTGESKGVFIMRRYLKECRKYSRYILDIKYDFIKINGKSVSALRAIELLNDEASEMLEANRFLSLNLGLPNSMVDQISTIRKMESGLINRLSKSYDLKELIALLRIKKRLKAEESATQEEVQEEFDSNLVLDDYRNEIDLKIEEKVAKFNKLLEACQKLHEYNARIFHFESSKDLKKVLDMKEVTKDTITKLAIKDLSLLDLRINIPMFVANEEYAKIVEDIYEHLKCLTNIYKVVNSVKHYKGYLTAFGSMYTALLNNHAVYNITDMLSSEIIGSNLKLSKLPVKIKDTLINNIANWVLETIDYKFVAQYFANNNSTFDFKTKSQYYEELVVGGITARAANENGYETKFTELRDSDLKVSEAAIQSFLEMVNKELIPLLKQDYPLNTFIQSLALRPYNKTLGYKTIFAYSSDILVPNGNSTEDDVIKFTTACSDLEKIAGVTDNKYREMFPKMTLGDVLYLYNLLSYHSKSGQTLTAYFVTLIDKRNESNYPHKLIKAHLDEYSQLFDWQTDSTAIRTLLGVYDNTGVLVDTDSILEKIAPKIPYSLSDLYLDRLPYVNMLDPNTNRMTLYVSSQNPDNPNDIGWVPVNTSTTNSKILKNSSVSDENSFDSQSNIEIAIPNSDSKSATKKFVIKYNKSDISKDPDESYKLNTDNILIQQMTDEGTSVTEDLAKMSSLNIKNVDSDMTIQQYLKDQLSTYQLKADDVLRIGGKDSYELNFDLIVKTILKVDNEC